MTAQEKYDKALSYIKRPGILSLDKWLKEETDFFTAPSSTLFHCNYPGGLIEHSINVLEVAFHNFAFIINRKPDLEYLKESIIICALFHDVCKTNQFKSNEKYIKDQHNQWKTYKGYDVEDTFPLGHGEKSLYLINQHIKLTQPEALAIRFHMGSFEVGTTIPGLLKYSYGQAYEHPLVKLIHAADVMAGTIEETIDYKSQAIQ